MCCVFGCVWPNAPPHRVDCRGISARVRRSSPSQASPPRNPPESKLHAIVIAPPKPSLILISIPWIRHFEVPESCSALVRIVVVNRSGEKKIEQHEDVVLPLPCGCSDSGKPETGVDRILLDAELTLMPVDVNVNLLSPPT
ncbi:Uncharacterized protein Rs2_12101 [Raphanus sativus]|nr:Uncharacterized protein Rs2_12101 [Raphanus sativus]